MKDGIETRVTVDPSQLAEPFDIAILGGGLAGLTLSLELKKVCPTARVLIIEKQEHPVPEAVHKVGESTVEIAAHYFRDILGLNEHLEAQQLRKFGLRMFFSSEDNRDIAQRKELGSTIFPPLSTYQLDRGRLENTLSEEVRHSDVLFLDGSKVQQVSLLPQERYHSVKMQYGGLQHEIKTRWVIDASGRNTLLQRQLGLAKKGGHHANAVWFRINHAVDIKEWSQDENWHARVTQGDRSLSTNHLMGPGYWVWIIRLASGSTSIGIVTDARTHAFDEINLFERSLAWLHQHEPQCADVIEQHKDQIQDFRVMKDYSYSCEQVFSGDRWCLVGEAGVSLDPLYSPGSDLIAIGNGLICDLVNRDLRGESIREWASVHDKLFLNLTSIWLNIYEQQYSLMDDPQIMVTKIIWDTAFYWGVFGLLYFHDAFRTIAYLPGVAANLSKIAVLSNRVQSFFREWHAIDTVKSSANFVDLYSPLDFMIKLHEGMDANLPPSKLDAQFAENVRLFERIAGQIVSTVIEAYADDFEHEETLKQIQRWQTEPYIAELIAHHRRDGRSNPIAQSWIAVDQRSLLGIA